MPIIRFCLYIHAGDHLQPVAGELRKRQDPPERQQLAVRKVHGAPDGRPLPIVGVSEQHVPAGEGPGGVSR